MSDQDRPRIKPLEEREDYRLWKIRVEAACEAKDVQDALSNQIAPEGTEEAAFQSMQRKASNTIVHAVTDKPLRVIRADVGNPYRMLKKLDERYDSKSTAARISKMTELVSLRYTNLRRNIGSHIDEMAALLEHLESKDTKIHNTLSIALLLAPIDVPEMAPVTAAIKILADNNATWESVTARIIEEHMVLRSNANGHERATVAGASTQKCSICGKKNHSMARCFLNPENPHNRLNVRDQARKQIRQHVKTPRPDAAKEKGRHVRLAMALPKHDKVDKVDQLMLESGTTSHMTAYLEHLQDARGCNVNIALGDNSSVKATTTGTRLVQWAGQDCVTEVSLSETLSSEKLAMSLLSVPALAAKGLCVLFTPEQALIIDSNDNFRVIDTAPRQPNGLYYIASHESTETRASPKMWDAKGRALIAIVKDAMYIEVSGENSDTSDLGETTSSFDDEDMPALISDDEIESEDEHEDGFYMGLSDATTKQIHSSSTTSARVQKGQERKSPISTWHNRLGHVASRREVAVMLQDGILVASSADDVSCDPCAKGKFRRSYDGSLTKAVTPGVLKASFDALMMEV